MEAEELGGRVDERGDGGAELVGRGLEDDLGDLGGELLLPDRAVDKVQADAEEAADELHLLRGRDLDPRDGPLELHRKKTDKNRPHSGPVECLMRA